MSKPDPDDLLTIARTELSAPTALAALDRLHVECLVGNLPRDYCTWEGLLCILDTTYPEGVFPTTRVKDEPDRDAGPRIVALIRWVTELQAERDDAQAETDKALREVERLKLHLEHRSGKHHSPEQVPGCPGCLDAKEAK